MKSPDFDMDAFISAMAVWLRNNYNFRYSEVHMTYVVNK